MSAVAERRVRTMVELPPRVRYVSAEIALEDMSVDTLLTVQAAYLLIAHEDRAHAACRRIDAISAEVARRFQP